MSFCLDVPGLLSGALGDCTERASWSDRRANFMAGECWSTRHDLLRASTTDRGTPFQLSRPSRRRDVTTNCNGAETVGRRLNSANLYECLESRYPTLWKLAHENLPYILGLDACFHRPEPHSPHSAPSSHARWILPQPRMLTPASPPRMPERKTANIRPAAPWFGTLSRDRASWAYPQRGSSIFGSRCEDRRRDCAHGLHSRP